MTSKLIAGFGLALAISSLAGWAQGPGPMLQGPRGPRPMPGMAGPWCPVSALTLPPPGFGENPPPPLALTDDQKVKLKDILQKSEAVIRPLRESGSRINRDLHEAVTAQTTDAAKVKSLSEAAIKNETSLLKAEIDGWTQIKALLSADQMTRLAEMLGHRPGSPPTFSPLPQAGAPPMPGGPAPAKPNPADAPGQLELPPPAPGAK